MTGDRKSAQELYTLGMSAAAAGDNQRAAELLEQCVAQRRNDAAIRNNLGAIYRSLRRFEDARREFEKAIDLQPGLAAAHANLGVTLRDLGQLDAAEQALRRATQIDPRFAPGLAKLGMVLAELGRAPEAIVALSGALAINPRDVESLRQLGKLHEKSGNLPAVIECVHKLIAAQPQNAEHYNSLGAALSKSDKLVEASDAFRRALSLDQKNLRARLNLSASLDRLGRRDEAVALLEQTVQMFPESHTARFNLAVLTGQTEPTGPIELFSQFFDDYADIFDQHLGELGYRAPAIAFRAVQSISPRRKLDILDIGCGTGQAAVEFQPILKSIVGIDFAPKMIEKARQRGLYSELICGELNAAMRDYEWRFDLVLSLDVFIYVGELEESFRSTFKALRAGGLFAFSIEKHEGEGFVLRPTQRYAHSMSYIRDLAGRFGFEEISVSDFDLRKQDESIIAGQMVVLRKP